MNQYRWRIKGLANNIDPTLAMHELARIESIYGKLTPSVVVKESENTTSPLHTFFDWDDKSAASKHRIQQARTLINNIEVVIVSNNKEHVMPVYEIVGSNKGYADITEMTVDELLVVKNNALRDLLYIQKKIESFDMLIAVKEHIQNAISALESI